MLNDNSHSKQLSYYQEKHSLTSILNIALNVHMMYTGAMDYYEDYLKDVSLLKFVINNWNVSINPKMKPFDDKVKELIQQAIEDHENNIKEYNIGNVYDLTKLNNPEYFLK